MKPFALIALATAAVFLSSCRTVAGYLWLKSYREQGGYGEHQGKK